MNYQQTVLHLLMSAPTIFPNELSVQSHLFTTCGSGFDWVDGELVCPPSSRERIGRTAEDCLNYCSSTLDEELTKVESGIPVLFSSCGSDNIFSIYSSTGCYHLEVVKSGRVVPTDSWKYGIYDFCEEVNSLSVKDYMKMYEVRTRKWGRGTHYEYYKTNEKEAYKKLRKLAKYFVKEYRDIYSLETMKKLGVIC